MGPGASAPGPTAFWSIVRSAADTYGEATVTIIAGNATGSATLTVTPKTWHPATAWQTGYAPHACATAPVTSDAAAVVVSAAPVTKSITITGSRTTVSGKPGILIDWITVGMEHGKTVTPFIRFPGETTFTAGSARPAIINEEETWQRKTGKRVTGHLQLTDDAPIWSNRVTIQAN